MIVHDPGGLGFRIERLWAFVAVHDADGDHDEGVVAAQVNGVWMPLIAADETRLQELLPWAEKIAQDTGKPVKLIRFETRVEVQTIVPLREGV